MDQLPAIERNVRGDGTGTLSFGLTPLLTKQKNIMAGWDGGLSSSLPTFVDIEDAEIVHRTIVDLREKALKKE